MKVKTVSGGVTADGIHYSSAGEAEVPFDTWQEMIDAILLASKPMSKEPPTILVSPIFKRVFDEEVGRA